MRVSVLGCFPPASEWNTIPARYPEFDLDQASFVARKHRRSCLASTPRLFLVDCNSGWAFLAMMINGPALLSVAFLIFATMGAAAEPRRVLILHAFGHAYSPWSDMAASFREELIKKSPEPIDIYEVSLDPARVKEANFRFWQRRDSIAHFAEVRC